MYLAYKNPKHTKRRFKFPHIRFKGYNLSSLHLVKHARKLRKLLLGEDIFIGYVGGSTILPEPLKKKEEMMAMKRLTEGDESVRTLLIEHNLRLVVYIARKFENTKIGLEDLISIGAIGLIKAVNTFDPSRQFKLATYASRCIENEILMHIRKTSKIKSEISIDEPLNVDCDGNRLLLSDILGTDENLVSASIEQEDDKRMVLDAVDRLSSRDREIMSMRFGLMGNERQTQKQVADYLGISQSYISRLEKRIITRLKKDLLKNEALVI